jgi:hypothetical protein
MQLRLIILGFLITSGVFGQEAPFKVLNDKEVNFLFNYYEQDGNHSPVTGGIGTEKLSCVAPLTTVNVPFDTVNEINVGFGMDYYTSASCNRIDRFVSSASSRFLSSASSSDLRTHFDIGYTRKNPFKSSSKGGSIAFSNEFDVNSFSGGIHYNKAFNNENTDLGIKANAYYDIWKLIYPAEIRDGVTYRFGNEEMDYDLDKRITGTVSFSWAQVLTKKLQFVFITDFVYQDGILNTPFHRVYFNDGVQIINPDTNSQLIGKTMMPEKLPRSRYKVPVGIRVNYYLTDRIVARVYYRYYFDDFGIISQTANIELPVKINSWLTVYPLYRYYVQTAAKYFAPFGEHPLDSLYKPAELYYTSDYDLSAFTMNKYGFGARISPLDGIHKWNLIYNHKLTFKYIDLKWVNYSRSDGLKANSISFDLGFVF